MTTEHRVSRLEEIIEEIRDRLNRMDNRFDRIEDRFERMGDRFERMEAKLDTQHRWVLGVIITMWSTTMLGVVGTLVTILVKL